MSSMVVRVVYVLFFMVSIVFPMGSPGLNIICLLWYVLWVLWFSFGLYDIARQYGMVSILFLWACFLLTIVCVCFVFFHRP